jgi:hypothetical protein
MMNALLVGQMPESLKQNNGWQMTRRGIMNKKIEGAMGRTTGKIGENSGRFAGYPAVRWRRVYVTSSWRNEQQPTVVAALRQDGHMVYDFKNPRPGDKGFHWSEIDPNWQNWTEEEYRDALDHPIAKRGYASDFNAMKWADTFVLILPCGRSAHLELGWACGQGKQTLILLDKMEPELMTKMVNHLCITLDEVREILAR